MFSSAGYWITNLESECEIANLDLHLHLEIHAVIEWNIELGGKKSRILHNVKRELILKMEFSLYPGDLKN